LAHFPRLRHIRRDLATWGVFEFFSGEPAERWWGPSLYPLKSPRNVFRRLVPQGCSPQLTRAPKHRRGAPVPDSAAAAETEKGGAAPAKHSDQNDERRRGGTVRREISRCHSKFIKAQDRLRTARPNDVNSTRRATPPTNSDRITPREERACHERQSARSQLTRLKHPNHLETAHRPRNLRVMMKSLSSRFQI
jgi:hypothetical protein